MPKPIAYRSNDVEAVLRASSVQARADALRRLDGSAAPPVELLRALAVAVGERSWRPDYEAVDHRGYLAFAGAMGLLPRLPESARWLALLQGLEGVANGGLEPAPNFAGWPWRHDLDHEASQLDMDRSWAEPAFTRFHGRLVPFVNEETRRKYGHRYLYNRSVLDLAFDGHRHILVGAGLELADRLLWHGTEQTLYPVCHYFVHAPQDYAAGEILQTWLASVEGGVRGDNRRRTASLPVDELQTLARALHTEDAPVLLDRIHEAWIKKYSLDAILEPIALVGARAIAGPDAANGPGARLVLFCAAAHAAFPWLSGADGVNQLMMAALLCRRLLGTAQSTESGDPAAQATGGRPAEIGDLLGRVVRHQHAASTSLMLVANTLVAGWERSESEQRGELLAACERLVPGDSDGPAVDAWRRTRP